MTHHVVVLAFFGISPFHLSVPSMVFANAALEQAPYRVTVCAEVAGPMPTTGGYDIHVRNTLTAMRRTDTVVLPSRKRYVLSIASTGEDKSANSGNFKAVNCYASDDLATWEFRHAIITKQSSTDLNAADRIIERPKVIYNDTTKKFVMWLHWEGQDYATAEAGVFTSVIAVYKALGGIPIS